MFKQSIGEFYLHGCSLYSLGHFMVKIMPKPPMTPEDLRALENAREEFHAAVKGFDNSVQDGKSITEVDGAITTMNQKMVAYRAFVEKFFTDYSQE